MKSKLIGKCPYCNGLFEVGDLKEDHAKCQWCSNELGVVEYVELGDEREILTRLMHDRLKLKEVGIDYLERHWSTMVVPILSIVPFVYFIYNKIIGAETSTMLYTLMGIGAVMLFGLWATQKDGAKKHKELLKLVERNDYSLINLSREANKLKQQAEFFLKQDSTSSRAKMYLTMSEVLAKLIPYVIAQGSVQDGYADGKVDGMVQQRVINDNPEYQREELIYILPPSHCPACNYIYKQEELKGAVINCPHCSCTIQLVDESVRTQSQMMVRDFLLRAAASQGKKTAKTIQYIAIALSVISLVMMLSMGIEKFFFSPAIILWFPVSLMFIVAHQQNGVFRMLKNRANGAVPDLLELEVLVKGHATVMLDDFIELKAEIIKTLKK